MKKSESEGKKNNVDWLKALSERVGAEWWDVKGLLAVRIHVKL